MKIFGNLFNKKVEEVKKEAVEAIDDLEENHPAILYGGMALIAVMGVTIISQRFEINCYKIVTRAQEASKVVVVR
jgi:hypothetical protein